MIYFIYLIMLLMYAFGFSGLKIGADILRGEYQVQHRVGYLFVALGFMLFAGAMTVGDMIDILDRFGA
jgi:hypothetical protein